MLRDSVKKYFDISYNLNCAETIIYACNEEYKLNLNEDTLKTMSAFGGGMGIEDVCGAITGALAILGIMFTKEKAHESTLIKTLSQEFFKAFQEKLGSRNCAELKAKYRNNDIRCQRMMDASAEVLENIILSHKELIIR